MNAIQLDLFKPAPRRDEYLYPWEPIHKWHPEVGGLASMHAVVLPEQGYCYGDIVRINYIEGIRVRCTVEHQSDPHWWKNGKEYNCTIYDLWPVLGVHF
jgi:hypothetical protein